MSKTFFQKLTLVFAICGFLTSGSFSQNKVKYNLFNVSDNSSILNDAELQKAVSNAVIINVNKEELLSLCENKNPEITIDIPYTQYGIAKLNLKRFDILKPDAKIVARTINGNEEVHLNDIAVSYTGEVEGLSNTLVSITFSKDNVTGLMVSNNENFILGSLNDRQGKATGNFILYKESDLKIKNSFMCGTDDDLSSEQIEKMQRIISEKISDASSTDLYTAEIAIEMDYITYGIYGSSVTNATNYALALMSASSAIYMKEENIRFVIPYLRVWTTPDPYTGTSSSALLNQFRNEWNANQQSVPRTLAHFITRRSGNLGGIAWLNALCASFSGGYGYGFSNTDGPIQPLPTYSWDVMVVSHEIGHNFGSPHTHSCSWPGGPIDSCYATEGGCYTGPVIPRNGTIMSYCHLTSGGISLTKGFGPLPKTLIRTNAENAPCMYISQRDLLLGYPNGGETFRTGNSTQIYWGTSLTGNVNLELSINNGTSWQTIQNNIPANIRIYDWTVPEVSSTTQAKLRIINSSDQNVGDTCDAVFKIILNLNAFSVISPPSTTRLDVSSASTQTQKFVWSKAGTNPTIRYKFKIKKLATTTEYSYDSDNNGIDTTATIRKSLLDSLAQLMGTTGDSVRCTWRVFGLNGIDSAVSSNAFLVTLVRTSVGINVISSLVPDKFSLGNNYPNPFNPETTIKFDIANSTFAELKIYDSRGSEVSTLVNEDLKPGNYEYKFYAGNLPSGAYFYRLKTSEFTETKRMILVK
jgi:hypothetical protein